MIYSSDKSFASDTTKKKSKDNFSSVSAHPYGREKAECCTLIAILPGIYQCFTFSLVHWLYCKQLLAI
jgi:hypothetical protein